MATRGMRIAVTGATGALGSEVLLALDAARLPIAQLIAVAGERSLGAELEFQDELVSVANELPALHGLDLVIQCAPAHAAPDIARAALRAEVPCIDLSGAFVRHAEVPLGWAGTAERAASAPLIATPVDAALVWLPVLRALAPLAEIAEVRGTILDGASASGRAGLDALSQESLALFNQQDLPESESLAYPLAFDCRPTSGDREEGGRRARETLLEALLARVLDPSPAVSARWIQVPVFIGQISALAVSFARTVDADEAARALAKTPGVELWTGGDEGPNLRAVSGRDVVVVAPPETVSANPQALFLWVAGDLLRLAAVNAAALAAARVAERAR